MGAFRFVGFWGSGCRGTRGSAHHFPGTGGGRPAGIAPAVLDGKPDHLEVAVVLVAFVPRARSEDAQGVVAVSHIPKLEGLVEILIRLVGLVVQDHMDVVAHAGGRVFHRMVAL